MLWLILYSLIYPLLLFCIYLISPFNSKIKKGLRLRRKQGGIKPWLNFPKDTTPIWFHVASGEFEYAKPVIRELKNKYPDQKILVTYFSPSVEKSLSQFKEVDFYCPTPWDTRKNWSEFIKHHKPKMLLIARTDLWPMMIHSASRNNIPSLLFSKTVSNKSFIFSSIFTSSLMHKINDIFCVTEDDKNKLSPRLPYHKRIHTSGDTRYDQCFYRLKHGKALKPLKNFNRPIFVAGSTWPSDERVLLQTISENIKQVSFIVAPHEPSKSHLSEFTKMLESKNLSWQFYSESESWDPKAVLIIDQVGILADLYKWGNFAFIGGSMDRSVHSVMEPLAQGLLCFVGPYHLNNREAQVFKKSKVQDMTPVQEIKDSHIMARRFEALYPSWSNKHQMELQMAVRAKMGASKIVVKWVENHF